MVTKEFCEDVPRNEDVIGDVETCVQTPKEVGGEKNEQQKIKIFILNNNLLICRFVKMESRELIKKFARGSNLKVLKPQKQNN